MEIGSGRHDDRLEVGGGKVSIQLIEAGCLHLLPRGPVGVDFSDRLGSDFA